MNIQAETRNRENRRSIVVTIKKEVGIYLFDRDHITSFLY